MVYCGTDVTETIWFGDHNSLHYIDMHLNGDVFHVTCCCDEDWVWTFKTSTYNYEKIKFVIMQSATNSCCMNNLVGLLDEIFEEDFGHLIVRDDGKKCCGERCEQCDHRDCLE